jgi:Niemann-Pick C1 protein
MNLVLKAPKFGKRKKRQLAPNGADSATSMGEYFSYSAYPEPYCGFASKKETACLEISILELWANEGSYDNKTEHDLEELTTESILEKINTVNRSGVFLTEKNFTELLSDISYDASGRITGAKATIMKWYNMMNATAAILDPVKGLNNLVDKQTYEFEGRMLEIMNDKSFYPAGLDSAPNLQRSFPDVVGSTIFDDIKLLTSGFLIVFAYVMIMLGKLDCMEQRIYISISGITGVLMGLIVSYGVCSVFGLSFGPLHNVLPFLLLGIGIDDMFVIVQSWDMLKPEDQVRLLLTNGKN